MRATDVMTREVVTVGPETSVKSAAEIMARGGFAALPVVDDDHRLVGIVAEADVLRDRIPADPRRHLRRDPRPPDAAVRLLVRGVMTEDVRSVPTAADGSDIARLFVDEHLRSVPVLDDDGALVGIVSRRDLLREVARPDAEIRSDLLRLVEDYTGNPGCWDVEVTDGVATIRRTHGAPEVSRATEGQALQAVAATVGGVVTTHVIVGPSPSPQSIDAPA